MKYTDFRILLVMEYVLPIVVSLFVLMLCEKRSTAMPPRDNTELTGRLLAAFMSFVIFFLLHFFIRFKV